MAKLLGAETLVFIAIFMNLNPSVFTITINMAKCSKIILNFQFCVRRIIKEKNLHMEPLSSVARREQFNKDSAHRMTKDYLIANRDCLLDSFTMREFIAFCKSGKNVFKWADCFQRKISKLQRGRPSAGSFGDDGFNSDWGRKEYTEGERSSESDESSSELDESSSESDESTSDSGWPSKEGSPVLEVKEFIEAVEDCVATTTIPVDYDGWNNRWNQSSLGWPIRQKSPRKPHQRPQTGSLLAPRRRRVKTLHAVGADDSEDALVSAH